MRGTSIVRPDWPVSKKGLCHLRQFACQLSHWRQVTPHRRATVRLEWQLGWRSGKWGLEGLPNQSKEESLRSQGCVVVSEPDDLIRELLERWLGEAGYRISHVTKDHVLPVVMADLVITDISEPGGPGNTIEALQAAYAAPILALSARFRRGLGGSSEPAQRLHVEKVLPKPFTRQQLLRAVRETIKSS